MKKLSLRSQFNSVKMINFHVNINLLGIFKWKVFRSPANSFFYSTLLFDRKHRKYSKATLTKSFHYQSLLKPKDKRLKSDFKGLIKPL